ncbi:hypothetical protein MOV08_35165 [Streptomyces yunnanensis]|uniref:Uncharacterized protein n=1 Tax=Streptomyces yunnanensis TaxID=156453 RepID=A0ABY8AKL7_9ACTN|nr:hypothetical protein [Streptomyces yunnanensis]WEB44007.1 hypothetical protein MOV08_35165 [Streptomyces yunnanensis]
MTAEITNAFEGVTRAVSATNEASLLAHTAMALEDSSQAEKAGRPQFSPGKASEAPSFQIPAHFAPRSEKGNLPKEAASLIEAFGRSHETLLKENENEVANLARQRESEKLTGEQFGKKLRDLANRNVAEYGKRQEKLSDDLIQIGNARPETQNAIVMAYEKVSNFFNQVWSKVADFFSGLINRFLEYFQKVKQFFQDLTRGIESVYSMA